jgi:CubicO group peptidase (beta-lactamase class C family)
MLSTLQIPRQAFRGVGMLALALVLAACGGGSDTPRVAESTLRQTLSAARAGDPGVSGAWITEDAIVLAADGVTRAGTTDPLTKEMWFHLASGEKAIVAMAIGVEVELGRLRWDSTLAEIFPELAAGMQAPLRDATVEQLLAHRSGLVQLYFLGDFYQVPPLDGGVMQQRAGFVAWATAQPVVAAPGTFTAYSNAGYITLAAVLERVGGKPYEDLLAELVLKPLGLRYAFGSPLTVAGNQPFGHLLDANDAQVPQEGDDPREQIPDWMHPAGIFSMPLADYARFAQIQLQALRGRPVLLQASTYRKLHTAVGPLVDGVPGNDRLGIALGWATERTGDGRLLSWFVGSIDSYQSSIVIDPKRNRAAVFFATFDVAARTESYMQDSVRALATLEP